QKGRLRGAVSARVRTCLDSLELHGEIAQRQIAHLGCESCGLRERRLFKSHRGTQSRFDCKARSALDAPQDERLELAVDGLADMFGNADVRSMVEFSGAIVGVETGNSEARYREDGRLTASGRPGDHDHPGRHQPPKSRSWPSCMSGGRSLRIRRPSASMIP